MSRPVRLNIICSGCRYKQPVELRAGNLGDMIVCDECGKDLGTGNHALWLFADQATEWIKSGLARRVRRG